MKETVEHIINDLINQYGYKALPKDISKKMRHYYLRKVPCELWNSENKMLYSKLGNGICYFWDRIVIGDYGAYVEFTSPYSEFLIAKGQEYRTEERYKNCKYLWLNPTNNDDTKIYLQKHIVPYADYKVGKYYVSVFDVKLEK